jgi:hypothetical protein
MSGISTKRIYEDLKYLNDQSLVTSFNTIPILIRSMDKIAINLAWTGTPVGQFFVEVCNNIDSPKWVVLPLSEDIITAGVADNAIIDIETTARYLRLTYTATSGTGSVDAEVFAKSLS